MTPDELVERIKVRASAERVAREVVAERLRQDGKWGEQNHRDGTGESVNWVLYLPPGGDARSAGQQISENARDLCQENFFADFGTWLDVLREEVAEAFAESDPARLRAELIQVAAVAVAWAEAIDRRQS